MGASDLFSEFRRRDRQRLNNAPPLPVAFVSLEHSRRLRGQGRDRAGARLLMPARAGALASHTCRAACSSECDTGTSFNGYGRAVGKQWPQINVEILGAFLRALRASP